MGEPTIEVLAQRIINQHLKRHREYLKTAHDLVTDPTVGTPAREDFDHAQNHPESGGAIGLRWWAQRSAVLNLVAAEEHILGLRAVLDQDQLLPLPAMALARSAFEAVIQTCWLIDVEATVEQRYARWAGRLLHDSQEPPKTLASFAGAGGADENLPATEEARDLGRKLMTKAGFELKAKGGDKADETALVTYRGATSGLTPNIASLIPRFTPGQAFLWATFSGATHSRGWLIAGLEGDATELFTSVLAPLLDTSDALAVEVGRYFGLNARPVVERNHMNRVGLIKLARPLDSAVGGVDHYRATVNAFPLPPATPAAVSEEDPPTNPE